jgi:hypothetical protein
VEQSRYSRRRSSYFVVHTVEAMTHRFVPQTPPNGGAKRFVEELGSMLSRYLAAA